jgi:hypothetical protein
MLNVLCMEITKLEIRTRTIRTIRPKFENAGCDNPSPSQLPLLSFSPLAQVAFHSFVFLLCHFSLHLSGTCTLHRTSTCEEKGGWMILTPSQGEGEVCDLYLVSYTTINFRCQLISIVLAHKDRVQGLGSQSKEDLYLHA